MFFLGNPSSTNPWKYTGDMWICTCASFICQSSTSEPKYPTIQPIWSSTLSHICELIGGISLAGKMLPRFGSNNIQQPPGKPFFIGHVGRGLRWHPIPRSPIPNKGTLQQRILQASLAGKGTSAPRVTSHKTPLFFSRLSFRSIDHPNSNTRGNHHQNASPQN